MMDMNTVILNGKLAAPAELREFESGSRLLRILVTTRTNEPRRRVDVIPVTLWDDNVDVDLGELKESLSVGDPIWVSGSLQRRFWAGENGRKSRLEVVANAVEVLSVETLEAV